MFTQGEIKQKLQDERFPHVYEWHDAPGTKYEKHAHKGAVTLYIVEGSVTLQFGDEVKELKAGNSFDVPIGKEHEALVGPGGCTYVVGEMIEGDS